MRVRCKKLLGQVKVKPQVFSELDIGGLITWAHLLLFRDQFKEVGRTESELFPR